MLDLSFFTQTFASGNAPISLVYLKLWKWGILDKNLLLFPIMYNRKKKKSVDQLKYYACSTWDWEKKAKLLVKITRSSPIILHFIYFTNYFLSTDFNLMGNDQKNRKYSERKVTHLILSSMVFIGKEIVKTSENLHKIAHFGLKIIVLATLVCFACANIIHLPLTIKLILPPPRHTHKR